MLPNLGGMCIDERFLLTEEVRKSEHIQANDVCSICQQTYADNSTIAKLDCGHIFHTGCLEKSIIVGSSAKSCPYCRNSDAYKAFMHETLLVAARKGRLDFVQAIIHWGTDVNKVDQNGKTALMIAIDYGQANLVDPLLKAGANVDMRSGAGISLLMQAILARNQEIILALINAGADLDMLSHGITPLILAAKYLNWRSVPILVEKGTEINSTDQNGMTALMFAVQGGADALLIRLFLANNASPFVQNKKGQNVLDIAYAVENFKVVDVLRQAMGLGEKRASAAQGIDRRKQSRSGGR